MIDCAGGSGAEPSGYNDDCHSGSSPFRPHQEPQPEGVGTEAEEHVIEPGEADEMMLEEQLSPPHLQRQDQPPPPREAGATDLELGPE